MRKNRGITIISLVITIIILIILAGLTINMAIGENGIITKARETKKLQTIAEAKEKIGTEILAAQVEATERNEELEQSQIEDIISKYGELQEDGDTIILNENGYEISLLEIYSGTITSTGSYSELKAKVALLEQQLEDATKSQSDASKELSDLKTILSQTTVTEAQILKDYTAYKDGKLITGTMENYAGQTVVVNSISSDDTNTYLTIPNAGYYDVNSKISASNSNLGKNLKYLCEGVANSKVKTIDIKSLCPDDYTKFTVDSFFIKVTGAVIHTWSPAQIGDEYNSFKPSTSYDASTGILTLSNMYFDKGSSSSVYLSISLTYDVYILY